MPYFEFDAPFKFNAGATTAGDNLLIQLQNTSNFTVIYNDTDGWIVQLNVTNQGALYIGFLPTNVFAPGSGTNAPAGDVAAISWLDSALNPIGTVVLDPGHAPVTVGSIISNPSQLIAGDDDFYALGGAATFYGGAGADFLNGYDGNDILHGQTGDDLIFGGAGQDQLYGEDGADVIIGEGGNDTMMGADGDDVIGGSAGNDTVDGGAGVDLISYAYPDVTTGVTVSLAAQGGAQNTGGGGSDLISGFENLEGGVGNDTLTGDANANKLYGVTGNDTIDGGLGADTMQGDAGDDTFKVDNVGDTIVENAGEGTDTVISTINFTLAAEVENLTLMGAALIGTGNAGNNVLIGNPFNNTLNGLDGNDTIDGGTGPDTLNGGAGDDVITSSGGAVLDGGADKDTVIVDASSTSSAMTLTSTSILAGAESNATFSNFESFRFTAGSGDDSVTLDSAFTGPNALDGGLGTDRLIFDASASATPLSMSVLDGTHVQLTYGGGTLSLTGVEGATLTGTSLNDQLLGLVGDDTLIGGDGDDNLSGNGGSNYLDAGAGNDQINLAGTNATVMGGDGDDTINGVGVANNVIDGGAGVDSFSYSYTTHSEPLTIGLVGTNIENYTIGGGTGADLFDIHGLTAGQTVHLDGNTGDNTLVLDLSNIFTDWTGLMFNGLFGPVNIQYANMQHIDVTLGAGSDSLMIADGLVTMHGGGGIDFITGNGASDVIYGDAGDDYLDGTTGENILNGGAGNDHLSGSEQFPDPDLGFFTNYGTNLMSGGDGNDVMSGGHAGDLYDGGDGVDFAYIDRSHATDGFSFSTAQMVSNAGQTLVDGTVIRNTEGFNLSLGSGDDTFTVSGNLANVTASLFAGDGLDRIVLDETGSSANFGSTNSGGAWTLTLNSVPIFTAYQIEQFNLATGSGFDTLVGGDGSDTLNGGGSGDTLDGRGGADTMIGGDGGDLYIVDNAGDTIIENGVGGLDTVHSSISFTMGANLEVLAFLGTDAINGTGNGLDNVIIGNAGANALVGGAGNDTLSGAGGGDTLTGGIGNDWYQLNDATDTVIENANQGIDTVQVSFSYTLSDNLENLSFTVSDGDFNATGNGSANQLWGTQGANTLTGLGGADVLIGYGGDDVLDGGDGADLLAGFKGADTLIGGLGADTLDGSAGIDSMVGGLGNDTYNYDDVGDVIVENVGEGLDTVLASIGVGALAANVENLELLGMIATGNGNELNNRITGNAANNFINGLAGADTMLGGLGDDSYFVDNAGDFVNEASGQGTDTIFSTINIALLAANVENLSLNGAAAVTATGNALNNIITGNAQNNVLNGGAGEDTLNGGLGNDSYIVNSAGDVVNDTGGNSDTITSFIDMAVLTANIENLTLAGTALIGGGNGLNNVIVGNGLGNTLTGGLGNDQLNGATGADTLSGGAGDDSYLVENAGDVVVENASEGADTVYAFITITALAANVEKLTLMPAGGAIDGTANDLDNRLNGNNFANTLTALGGNDVIQGLGGNDRIIGGAGQDNIYGGAGNDVFVYQAVSDSGVTGATRDIINDFIQGADTLDLSAIDAIAGGGDDAFSFIGASAFSHTAGELRFNLVDATGTANDFTIVSMDLDGDGVADSQITLRGLVTLTSADFVL